MLEIKALRKVYEDGTVGLANLDLSVKAGEIMILLGANGAGKTTTIMLILGFTEPTSGTVTIKGIDVNRDPLEAKKHVAYVSENVMLYPSLTARQNLDFFTQIGGRTNLKDKEYREVFHRVGLADNAYHRRVSGFSKGMRQRLGIAIAILKQAELIVLDEPTSGLDPKGGFEFLQIIKELKDEGRAILMSSHDIFRARDLADNVGIMRNGAMLEVINKTRLPTVDLQQIYLEYMAEAEAGESSAKVL